MKNIITCLLISSVFFGIDYEKISPTAAVCLVGAEIKSRDQIPSEKYKRKDCPVCKGKGWYISGDGIEKVDCGYCEPEQKENNTQIIKGLYIINDKK